MQFRRALVFLVAAALVAGEVGCKTTGAASCPPCPRCPEAAAAQAAGSRSDPSTSQAAEVLARIGGETITAKDLMNEVGGRLKQIDAEHFEQTYEIKRNALEAMIDDRLVRSGAEAAGKTVGEYLEAQIMPEPIDEKLLKLAYDENAEAIGRPFEEIAPMLRAELEARARREALEGFLAGLREQAGVAILLAEPDKPRFEVSVRDGEPARGPADAPVTIVGYSDFECPYCARGHKTMHELRERYGNKLRLVFRNFPLSFHASARKAAEAALCAHAQGKFWEMHDKLFASNDALAVEQLKGYAGDLGLDRASFDDCLDGGAKGSEVEEQIAVAEKLGIKGTPAFFVNGIAMMGAMPLEEFVQVIDAELARTR